MEASRVATDGNHPRAVERTGDDVVRPSLTLSSIPGGFGLLSLLHTLEDGRCHRLRKPELFDAEVFYLDAELGSGVYCDCLADLPFYLADFAFFRVRGARRAALRG